MAVSISIGISPYKILSLLDFIARQLFWKKYLIKSYTTWKVPRVFFYTLYNAKIHHKTELLINKVRLSLKVFFCRWNAGLCQHIRWVVVFVKVWLFPPHLTYWCVLPTVFVKVWLSPPHLTYWCVLPTVFVKVWLSPHLTYWCVLPTVFVKVWLSPPPDLLVCPTNSVCQGVIVPPPDLLVCPTNSVCQGVIVYWCVLPTVFINVWLSIGVSYQQCLSRCDCPPPTWPIGVSYQQCLSRCDCPPHLTYWCVLPTVFINVWLSIGVSYQHSVLCAPPDLSVCPTNRNWQAKEISSQQKYIPTPSDI